MESSKIVLKVTVIIHFILTVWATTSSFLPDSYIYMNLFVLLIGVFANVHSKSEEAVFLFFVLHCFTIAQDVLFIGIYQPIADATYEVPNQPNSVKNIYRFSLGICIVNLIIKPATAFLLYKVWQERQGKPVKLPFNIPWIASSALPAKPNRRSSNVSEDGSEMETDLVASIITVLTDQLKVVLIEHLRQG
ncbi:type-1 angiotensin II receptor-associated protein-like [Mytilus californianus]|uniref:type-1 angiotensin II receptor-associated protein-like n=1 Tax=Mytilus californianus TaxID=6549 RepID=UPI002245EF97|nr:type-1 angiotensin II receptor-associated protein-like [Mytilus californianus]